MTSPVQESFENFENLKFYTFESKDVLLDVRTTLVKRPFCNNIKTIDTKDGKSVYPYLKSFT